MTLSQAAAVLVLLSVWLGPKMIIHARRTQSDHLESRCHTAPGFRVRVPVRTPDVARNGNGPVSAKSDGAIKERVLEET